MEEIKTQGIDLIRSYEEKRDASKINAISGESGRNSLAASGIAAVCEALNRGAAAEVLVSATACATSPPAATAGQFLQPVSMCKSCTHLALGARERCEICGNMVEIFSDPQEAILRKALGQSVSFRRVERLTDQVACLLRFRAEARPA